MKKVCHLTNVHSAYDGRIFEKECCSLAKAGYEVYLIAPNAQEKIINEVNIVGVDAKRAGRIYRIFILSIKIYKKALEIDAHIYHFHDPELLPIGAKLKKKGKIVIFDSHESVPEQIMTKEYIPIPFRKLISKTYERYEKRILKKMSAVITVTPHILERLSKINSNSVQITNYPIVTDIPPIKKNPTNSVCFAGTISPMWMHENIINALSFTDDIKYHLAGPINKSYLKQLSDLSNNNIRYFGKLQRTSVLEFIQSSKIGMALYDYSPELGNNTGTLGNTKIFEYMLAGIPIICTDFLLWEKIISEERCGICVNPRNTSAITKAINYISKNPEIAKEMGINGQKAIKERYNWTSQEKILLNLYHCLVHNTLNLSSL